MIVQGPAGGEKTATLNILNTGTDQEQVLLSGSILLNFQRPEGISLHSLPCHMLPSGKDMAKRL